MFFQKFQVFFRKFQFFFGDLHVSRKFQVSFAFLEFLQKVLYSFINFTFHKKKTQVSFENPSSLHKFSCFVKQFQVFLLDFSCLPPEVLLQVFVLEPPYSVAGLARSGVEKISPPKISKRNFLSPVVMFNEIVCTNMSFHAFPLHVYKVYFR